MNAEADGSVFLNSSSASSPLSSSMVSLMASTSCARSFWRSSHSFCFVAQLFFRFALKSVCRNSLLGCLEVGLGLHHLDLHLPRTRGLCLDGLRRGLDLRGLRSHQSLECALGLRF